MKNIGKIGMSTKNVIRSKNKLSKFRTLFVQKRKEILDSIKNQETELDTDGDDVDQIQGSIISDMNDKLSKREILMLEKLDAAISKIDSGTFGTCDDCGEAIGEKRLLALPGCEFCVECAEQQELEFKQFNRI